VTGETNLVYVYQIIEPIGEGKKRKKKEAPEQKGGGKEEKDRGVGIGSHPA